MCEAVRKRKSPNPSPDSLLRNAHFGLHAYTMVWRGVGMIVAVCQKATSRNAIRKHRPMAHSDELL
jgi:hypothetical protein